MNYDDVIPLNEIGKIENVTVYNQSYVNKQQKRIAELEKENAELKAQIEKMKDCLNKWYKQHNDDDYTETFYDNLLRDTEKCLWGYSVND